MPAGVQPSDAHRAALALHAMREEDRRWILAALPASQQASVQPLLAELRELGIPQQAGMFDALLRQHEPAATLPLPQDLDDARLEQLARLLAVEPARITGVLLGAHRWPWQQRLLSALPAARRVEVQLHAAGSSRCAALEAAVLQEIATRLQPLQAAPPPGPAWLRLHRRLVSLGSAA